MGFYMTTLRAFALTMVFFVAGCASSNEAWGNRATIQNAVDDASRPGEHVARDESRKPVEILTLSGVEPGDVVADLAVGSGYYTALLSRIVGPTGQVFAVDPTPIFEAFPQARETFPKYQDADPRENVSYSISRMDELAFPRDLDAVFMVLYYHDTIWTEENRSEMNRRIYEALRPGGRFIVVDHHALKGAGDGVTLELHRMDSTSVIPEISSAGFSLIVDSDVLSHPDDPKTESVFNPAIRGQTDRFVYVFERPAEPDS